MRPTDDTDIRSRVHRWFHTIPRGIDPPKFHYILERFGVSGRERILDPFAGEGTTLIESQFAGLQAFGFDINPFLHFVGRTVTNWRLKPERATELENLLAERYQSLCGSITLENLPQFGLSLPAIEHPYKWWRADVLRDLLVLKKAIRDTVVQEEYRRFFELALASVLVSRLSNLRREGNQTYLTNRDNDLIQVWESFAGHLEQMIADLGELQDLLPAHQAESFLQDATALGNSGLPRNIDCIITSPPYPDRFSYTWNTLGPLYFFDHLTDRRGPSDLDDKSIGGSWGTSLVRLLRENIRPANPIIGQCLSPLMERLQQKDQIEAKYLIKYFNLLVRHFTEMEKLRSETLQVALLIGEVYIGDEKVATDQLFAEVLEGISLGYKVSHIESCGPYLDRDDRLKESIVFASL